MDNRLSQPEVDALFTRIAMPTLAELGVLAKKAVRENFLREVETHLMRLAEQMRERVAQGWASIEVPEFWATPITQVLDWEELPFTVQGPPKESNMVTITITWPVPAVVCAPKPKPKRL